MSFDYSPLYYRKMRNILRKKRVFILKITKRDAFFMRSIGYGEYINKSYSRKPTYYLVEERNALKAYKKYRDSLIVK